MSHSICRTKQFLKILVKMRQLFPLILILANASSVPLTKVIHLRENIYNAYNYQCNIQHCYFILLILISRSWLHPGTTFVAEPTSSPRTQSLGIIIIMLKQSRTLITATQIHWVVSLPPQGWCHRQLWTLWEPPSTGTFIWLAHLIFSDRRVWGKFLFAGICTFKCKPRNVFFL